MVANARSNLEQLKAATAKAQADSRVRIAKADTNKGVTLAAAKADAKIRIDASEQVLVKLEGHQRRLTQSNRANNAIRVSNTITANKQILQSGMIVHQQQMQASKATQAAHTANAKVAVAAQKQIQASINATAKIQVAIINSNRQAAAAAAAAALSSQNHQQRIAYATFQQQQRLALLQQRQAARTQRQQGGGGGWGAAWGTSGLLQGLGTVGKALGGGGGSGLLGGLVSLGVGGFAGGAIVGQITAVVKNFTEAAAAADAVSAAYARQQVASRALAGSQAEVNALLEVYDEATGGVLSNQKQLEGVTKLLSVGFADTVREAEQAAKSIRGISLAVGRPQDAVENDLILEMFTQRGMRLDQLGLQYDVVRQKTNELMQANASLTKQQAYQQAVLDHAIERYGDLADSAAGQATEVERLAAAYQDLGLQLANQFKGPVNFAASKFTEALDLINSKLEHMNRITPKDVFRVGDVKGGLWEGDEGTHNLAEAQATKLGLEMELAALEAGNFNSAILGTVPSAQQLADEIARISGLLKAATHSTRALRAEQLRDSGAAMTAGPDVTLGGGMKSMGPTADQIDEMVSFVNERNNIMAQANADLLAENRSYFSERASVERDYQQRVSEEAADFARQRARDNAHFAADLARAEREIAEDRIKIQDDLAKDIARANRDHARDLAKMQEDLDDNIADARKQASKREEDAIEDFNEKQADAREDSGKKILEMEEDFKKSQKRAAEDHNDAIMDAASHLDAAAVYAEQREYARKKRQAEEDQKLAIEKEKERLAEELTENEEAHNKTLEEIKENLQEEIDAQNEAHEERVKDANEAHALQLKDQQEAAAERLEEQGKEDTQRLEDMKAAHILRQSEEDADRLIRLGRDEAHHNDQLTEMNRVHGERITQIGTHAGAELTALETAHKARMLELGFLQAAWQLAENRANDIALAEHKKYLLEDRKLVAEQRRAQIKADMEEAISIGADLGPLQKALDAVDITINSLTGDIGKAQEEIDALPRPETTPIVRDPVQASGFSAAVTGEGGRYMKLIPPTSQITGGAVSRTSNIRVDAGAIVINAPPGMSTAGMGDEFERRLLTVLQKVARAS